MRNGTASDDLIIGKKLILTDEMDSYKVEIKNNSTQKINIIDLEYNLNNEIYKTDILTSKDFDSKSTSKDLSIGPNEMKAFEFMFSKTPKGQSADFISIRPFIKYQIDNSTKISVLPPVIYSPVPTDVNIKKWIEDN